MTLVQTIFFDVDGTLVDSKKDIVNAMNFTLRQLGLEVKPSYEIVSYVGTGVKDLVRKSLGKGNDSLVDKGVEAFSAYYLNHATDESRLYPHVEEVLKFFKDKRKYILTNRYAKFADATLRGFGIIDYFDGILGGDDESCLKPSACVLDGFFESKRLDRSKSIIVGDMAIDIMTGKNSGIMTCWVTYGLGKAEDVEPLNPDYKIDDLLELTRVVK